MTDAIKELARMGHTALDEVERLLTREAELEAENAKLRKALEEMAEPHPHYTKYYYQRTAREALDT